jgi:anaerobic ribonucleoside-triphosphate reductase activating protein
MDLRVAQFVSATEAEGPGLRCAIWLQGCPLRCPGCCNPEMLPFNGGEVRSVDTLLVQIEQAALTYGVEGITLLGGEPFAHAQNAAVLAAAVQKLGLSVMIFSGYTLGELRAQHDPHVNALVEHCDILVDGPYLRDQPDTVRRWIGSRNQRIHFLSDRYCADDPRWRQPNTLEIRLVGDELTVNGFPAPSAVGVWRRPRRVEL